MRPTLADRVEKSGLYELRLRRAVHAIARSRDLPEDKLLLIAERQCWRCAVCVRPFVTPVLYRVGGAPRAIICRDCGTALAKTNERPELLTKHQRFRGSDAKRERLARYLAIFQSKGPFEVDDSDSALQLSATPDPLAPS